MEEDRNISMNMSIDMDTNMMGNSCGCGYDDKKMMKCNMCPDDKDMTRCEMLKKIKCYKFAVTEIALYLDTHPEDTKALCLHRRYCNELKDLCDKYQKVYGPLTIEYPCNKWRWLEEPWPWEGGCYNVDL